LGRSGRLYAEQSKKQEREILMKKTSDSWKSKGHYLKDGTEWKGNQHAHNGQVMTGKTHTATSKNLYHFMDLNAAAKKKVLAKGKSK
jgi:hypothetical protein